MNKRRPQAVDRRPETVDGGEKLAAVRRAGFFQCQARGYKIDASVCLVLNFRSPEKCIGCPLVLKKETRLTKAADSIKENPKEEKHD
jgi:hypothetical protein